MTLEATGARTNAILLLHQMVAASSTLRNKAKVQEEAAAAARVRLPWQEAEEAKFPCAVIMQTEGGLTWYLWSGGARNYLRPRGSLKLKLIDRIRFPDDQDASEIDFGNFCDGVIADVAALAGHDGWLSIQEIRETLPPSSTHPSERTPGGPPPFFHAIYEVDWDSR